MERRQLLRASLSASPLPLTHEGFTETAPSEPREYYQIRGYILKRGPQMALTESYFAGALIPALTRMGIGPVGAFTLDIGPDTPTYYLVIPTSRLEALVNLDLQLTRDPEFMKSAAPFWNATSKAPAFQRVEVSLSRAFAGWSKLTPPASSTGKAFK